MKTKINTIIMEKLQCVECSGTILMSVQGASKGLRKSNEHLAFR